MFTPVVVGCRIRIQDNSNFARVDVMVEINNSKVAVIGKLGEGAIELDSRQFAAMTHINCIIKEDGTTGGDAGRAHPSQAAVRIEDGRLEIAASSLKHHVVVAQIGVIGASLQDRRILVSACIVEGSGRDSGVNLL